MIISRECRILAIKRGCVVLIKQKSISKKTEFDGIKQLTKNMNYGRNQQLKTVKDFDQISRHVLFEIF